ncbi:MAG: radical SAM protein [Anaerolineae bacterium]|nr:radical SAM protein [Anaerolineae bacterium]
MVILGDWEGRPLAISIKPNCLTISIDGPEEADVFSYDYAGRLWTAFLDGISYRRGLDGRMLARRRGPGNVRERRWLPDDEAAAIQEHVRKITSDIFQAIDTATAHLNTPLPQQGYVGFTQAVSFDRDQADEDVKKYHQIYKPVGILPPDQYMAVILQATEGCSFNTCAFCTLYKDRPFHLKIPEEFQEHAAAVRDFLGDGLSLRRTIFLGDANTLAMPMSKLLPFIEITHQTFDVYQLGGLYAFLDGFSGERKSAKDYAQLAARGLVRVYVGLESGNEALLKFLHKPGTPTDAIRAVQAMKRGGLSVGVIVLLGPGGNQYAQAHVADTIKALKAMRLGQDDIIYFSHLVTDESLPYVQEARQAGLQSLTPEEQVAQGNAIEKGLVFYPKTGKPIISRYDIREFIY